MARGSGAGRASSAAPYREWNVNGRPPRKKVRPASPADRSAPFEVATPTLESPPFMDPRPRFAARRRSANWSPRRAARTLGALALLGLCSCVSRPSAEEVANLGYRSPAQTFGSFQVAVRADSALLEYRCLSVGFRERNRISQLTWREFRDEWYAQNPFLRSAVAKASIVAEESLGPDDHLIVAEAYGRKIHVRFVREGFYQLYAGAMLHADELLPWQRGLEPYLGSEAQGPHSTLLTAAIELDPARVPEHPTEFRIGLEWKIDGIEEPASD